MSDKTIRLLIDLTYNQDVTHADDEEAIEWFNSILLGDHLQLGDFGELGDMIGSVKVIEGGAARIEELEAENKLLNEQMAAIEEHGTESLNALPDCLMQLAPALVENDELKKKLAKAVDALERIVNASKYFGNCPEATETTVRYAHETTNRLARITLAELKGEK